MLDGQRTFDLFVRLDENYREDLDVLKRLVIETPAGGAVKLEDVAKIYRAGGPNTINREQVRRRITVQCNVRDRGLVDVVNDIKERIGPSKASCRPATSSSMAASSKASSRRRGRSPAVHGDAGGHLPCALFKMFHSANLSLQVMAALPMAFIGAVAALVLTGQTLTVAALVGFIALVGVASRNGILLLNHYLHLVKYEGKAGRKR